MLFDRNKAYRRNDLVGKDGQIFNNNVTLDRAIDCRRFPPGRVIGRIRVRDGAEPADWWESLSTAKIAIPEGFGGEQPGAGRKRKQQSEQSEAA
jgi:hypothetical protein